MTSSQLLGKPSHTLDVDSDIRINKKGQIVQRSNAILKSFAQKRHTLYLKKKNILFSFIPKIGYTRHPVSEGLSDG